jgi:uncharacterized protein (TIGR00369 family)
MPIEERHSNPHGMLHGGVVTTLLDEAAGQLVTAWRGVPATLDSPHASIEMNASFLAGAKPGDELAVEGRAIRLGRTMGFCQAEARRKSDGALVATGRVTFAMGRTNAGRPARAAFPETARRDAARLAGERLTRSPFSGLIGAHLEETGEGFVRLSLIVEPHHLNPYGVLHGGVATTLLDSSAGVLLSVLRGPEEVRARPHATVEMNTSFLSAARPGETLISEARILRLGARFAVAETDLRRWGGEGVIAAGRFTFAIRGQAG